MANKEYCFNVQLTGWVSVLATARTKARALEKLEAILQEQVLSQPIGHLRQKASSIELLGCNIDPELRCCCLPLMSTIVDNCSERTRESGGLSRDFVFDVQVKLLTPMYVKARSKPEALRRLDAKIESELFSAPIKERNMFSHLAYSAGYEG